MSSKGKQPPISQIGIVVRDLESAMEDFCYKAGIRPWNIYTNSAPPLRCVYHGHPSSYTVRVAVAKSGQMQIELIEYLEGDSIHRDFLDSKRTGVEHLGIFVPDLEAALKPYKDMGVGILQQVEGFGSSKDGRFAYLDSEPYFGTILELIQRPSIPTPPERNYP
jgi:hypothetical protein